MKVYKDLYVSSCLKGREKKLLKQVKKRSAKLIDIYIIALSLNDCEQLEIFDTAFLQQDFIDLEKHLIVGMALGKSDAFDIVKSIVEESYNVTGNVDIKAYIMQGTESLC